MGDIILKFANDSQYEKFIQDLKKDIMSDLEKEKTQLDRSSEVFLDFSKSLRAEIHHRYHQNIRVPSHQHFYEFFRVALLNERVHISNLGMYDPEVLNEMKKDLIRVVDHYRLTKKLEVFK
ncbi:hypothetical protein [Jeotgalibacillus terrae]|uniref:Uncharacterized protein n=1 Tax=Jeotgalibacillus terrae TaxID=587735 RepID=A0ABW5ZEM8_9BACL|nr:hypothetical protein [Jeotgalibacillus terrae]MBM7577702.1 hypothetical protein [Jeotgalibacillus terrae]